MGNTLSGRITWINAVSGSQSGYTVDPRMHLDSERRRYAGYINAASGAGGVTVEYLDISNDLHATATITIGSGWTIEHNKIHDSYRNEGEGVAIYGGDESTIECVTCLPKWRLGHSRARTAACLTTMRSTNPATKEQHGFQLAGDKSGGRSMRTSLITLS